MFITGTFGVNEIASTSNDIAPSIDQNFEPRIKSILFLSAQIGSGVAVRILSNTKQMTYIRFKVKFNLFSDFMNA